MKQKFVQKRYAEDTQRIHGQVKILSRRAKEMAYRVLLVEDDEQIREIITDYFGSKDSVITVETASDGDMGRELIHENEYDLIMLDVMLPGTDGFSLCRYIRAKSSVPILFLTARGREEDKLYGYELGCDDYIVKPFSLAELYAKTNAMLRRAKGMTVSSVMTCGKISLDPVKMTVSVEGSAVELPPKEYEILKYLMEHKDWVVERETLLTRIWGYDYYGGDRVVDNHIKKLRKAIGSAGEQIKTVISKGYKLTDKI